mmetsp:Transcript_8410/g.19199  ORF Transcript_8410/g.19199 Transcript_8410/m.19199 type:complete len:385 (+) Transcript_8410:15-1169(+)
MALRLLTCAAAGALMMLGSNNNNVDAMGLLPRTGNTFIAGRRLQVKNVDASLTTKASVAATHLNFLVDDTLKQNVTFADKKKMLQSILGLKVVDYAYTHEFVEDFVENSSEDVHFFDGEPKHWYKEAYYRGLLAESVAYKLEQALHNQTTTCFKEKDDLFASPSSSLNCCDFESLLLERGTDETFQRVLPEKASWYGKMDVVVTELVGAVQALTKMSFNPVGFAKLLSPGLSGGPMSLGMFIGSVLEVISHKGFGDYSKSMSSTNSGVSSGHSGFQPMVETAAERIAEAVGIVSSRHLDAASTLENGFDDINKQRDAARSKAEARLAELDAQAKQRAAQIAEIESENDTQKKAIGQTRSKLDEMARTYAATNTRMLRRIRVKSG